MNTVKRIVSLLLVCLFLIPVSGCEKNESGESSESSGIKTKYTILVQTEGKMPLEDVEIKVYDSNDPGNLIYKGETDKNGQISFNGMTDKSYFYVVSSCPSGFVTEEKYPVISWLGVSETTLKTSLLPYNSIEGTTFGLGSVMCDFDITDVNGNAYKLSELLETKKAVVLNFWFIGCGPCRMEFPYMQESYDKYKDEIEIIAINPVDGTDSTVKSYANQKGLTLPMAVGDNIWNFALKLQGYPTTVVIDRYGVITMMHVGSITSTEEFDKIFDHFTADDYKQSLIRIQNQLG